MEISRIVELLLSLKENLKEKLSQEELEALERAASKIALDETLREIEKRS